jgi:hypothetical protein
MAEEAVISEPVSARWFPVPGENTGKFADFGLESAKAPRLSEENSIAYQVNSLAAKAGKICERSGKPEAVNSESESDSLRPFGIEHDTQSCCSMRLKAASSPHGERPHSINGS